jgi:hypothetical protein
MSRIAVDDRVYLACVLPMIMIKDEQEQEQEQEENVKFDHRACCLHRVVHEQVSDKATGRLFHFSFLLS